MLIISLILVHVFLGVISEWFANKYMCSYERLCRKPIGIIEYITPAIAGVLWFFVILYELVMNYYDTKSF